jgi:ELWxxDGT repeat protein
MCSGRPKYCSLEKRKERHAVSSVKAPENDCQTTGKASAKKSRKGTRIIMIFMRRHVALFILFGGYTIANGKVYFTSGDACLYSANADGTGTMTRHTGPLQNGIYQVPMLDRRVAYKGSLIFGGYTSLYTYNLYRYDFAQDSVRLITPLYYVPGTSVTSATTDMCVYDSLLFFGAALDSARGFELYKYDGNAVSLVADINPGVGGSNPSNFKVVNGYLYFVADDGIHGKELFRLRSATGVEHVAWDGAVSVYPNPATSSARIELSINRPQALMISLFDMAGRQVFASSLLHFDAGRNFYSIPLHNLCSGNYVYRITQSDRSLEASGILVKQ